MSGGGYKYYDDDKIKVLNLCLSFDCAGVAYFLSDALNKYSDKYTSRQVAFRKMGAFNFPCDIQPGSFTHADLLSLISDADIIHLHHELPGKNILPLLKDKKVIYHSHGGHRFEHKKICDTGALRKHVAEFSQLVLTCCPADVDLFDKAAWLPNVLSNIPQMKPELMKKNPLYGLNFVHSASGAIKDTAAFTDALNRLIKKYPNLFIGMDVIKDTSWLDTLKRRRLGHVNFDNLNHHHGMSTYEAMAQGLAAISIMTDRVQRECKELFGSVPPIVDVREPAALEETLESFIKNPAVAILQGVESREWMMQNYTPEKIIGHYEIVYDALAVDKKTIAKKNIPVKKRYSITLCNHRLADGSWTRGEWVEEAFRRRDDIDLTVVPTEFKRGILPEIIDANPKADAVLFLSEYTLPLDLANGDTKRVKIPLMLWTDDSVVWEKPGHLIEHYWKRFLPAFDVVFELFTESMPKVRAASNKQALVECLPHAWEPRLFEGLKNPTGLFTHDITFWGRMENSTPGQTGEGWYVRRGDFILELKKRFPQLFHGFTKDARTWAAGIANSKIVLNFSMQNNLNMRVLETLGAGRMLITDRSAGAAEFFENEKDLLFYDSLEQAGDQIEYFLRNDAEREAIAANGNKTVYFGKHTYDDRINRIIEVVKEMK